MSGPRHGAPQIAVGIPADNRRLKALSFLWVGKQAPISIQKLAIPLCPRVKSGSRLCRYVAADGCRLFACLRKASVFIERGVEKNGDKSSRSRYKVQPGGHSSYFTPSTWGGWTAPSMRLEINVFESGCGDLHLVPVPTVVVPMRAAIC